MENTTKALLIATAILITIVIIALGVLLLKNLNNSSQQADKASNAISNATNSAYKDIINQRIKSYEKSYDNVEEAKEAYFNVEKSIKEYNSLLNEGEAEIKFAFNVHYGKNLSMSTFPLDSFNNNEEKLEILLKWGIEENKNKMEIKRDNKANRIIISLGTIKNHDWDDIFIDFEWK